MATDAPHTTVYVPMERDCDIHPGVVAYADASIPGMGWGWICKECFDSLGCSLGLGKGQRLIVGEPPVRDKTPREKLIAELAEELGIDESEVDF